MNNTFSPSQIQQANQTDLRALLQSFGLKQLSNNLFENPFRTEKKSSSFSIFRHRVSKIWLAKDLSSNKNWNVLKLTMEVKKMNFVEAMKFLLSFNGQYEQPTGKSFFLSKPNSYRSIPTHKEATPSQKNSLTYYLKSIRFVSPTLSKEYIEYRQYQYEGSSIWYYAIFFKNDSEGYVIRNKAMKSPKCLGASDITTILYQDSTEWIIFEGFIDFLSAITYYKKPFKGNVMVLNSVTNTEKGIVALKALGATKIFTFLDNDTAGKIATNQLKNTSIPLIDKVSLFGECKDFNQFLATKKTLATR
ncbi:toprim domain-containing protein [Bernardetia sp. OM2101]|uniref:toprim domain-containing protein n=1 Tax=Bernardetia sp. OM2101 TaxID=3344876 RepID=UPI0035CEA1BC